ncbi:trafficking protein particle complex subunit 2-like [Artemia franciscana]|uniref:Trafficking protein particle complex subunit 2 n=1 Tax=Artemia franciscana TaxID=6661 RepID=A0AA88IDZ2_ARTSF|nr:hypothetical protein QYM36_000723 [Artemia franciscana]
MGTYHFLIVGQHEGLVYEMNFIGNQKDQQSFDEHRHLIHFVGHNSLDVINETRLSTNAMYLKTVDRFNEWFVSAFVTASHAKFIMLHDIKNDEGIKNFFNDAYEHYIKLCMNPFYNCKSYISSPSFDKKIQYLGRKFLAV